MAGDDGRRTDGRSKDAVDSAGLVLRSRNADQWAAGADERERLADERERLADEREALADERGRLADRHDHILDRREADRQASGSPEDDDGAAEVLATRAALQRAQEAMRRAEAEVIRARQAAARAEGRAARRAAGSARVDAADQVGQAADADERAWLAERRDFMAADRDELAGEREEVADERDATADLRERLADHREYEALSRERRMDEQHRDVAGTAARPVTALDGAPYADPRKKARRDRESASVRRRAAAADRRSAAASWGPETYGPMLLSSFAQLAQQLFGTADLPEALPTLLKYVVGAVAGCDWASITVLRRDGAVHTVASNALAAELDELQFGTGIGPSVEALRSDGPVYVRSLADSPHWPVLAATATQLGVSSVLCHGLFVQHGAQWSAVGTLNLYGASADAFSDDDREFASILAAFVAVATAIAQRRDDVERREAALHRGLSTRDVIGQAKGILMERSRLSAGDAFDLLRRASQRLNRKLAEVAQHLADTGELPK